MRFLAPATLIFVTLLCSPFLGLVRDALFDHLGKSAVKVIGAVLGLAAAGAFAAALRGVRDHRALRYSGLLLVLLLLLWQTLAARSEHLNVDVVEKVHILQYGLLTALFYRALLPAGRLASPALLILPVLWAGLTGITEESVQAFFQLRVGDVRDVRLNFFAALCGLIFALSLAPPSHWRWRSARETWISVSRWAAALLLAGGLFLHHAHLGHMIEDPAIGRFRSWFTAEQLARLSDERALAWQQESPTGLVAWHREDYYLTEAARHANHRNGAFSEGQWTLAWQANLILERHYDPFLDLTSFRHGGKHRYPPEVRRELEKNAQPDPSTYLSPVQANRVFVWSRAQLWSAVVAGALIFLALPPLLIRGQEKSSSSIA